MAEIPLWGRDGSVRTYTQVDETDLGWLEDWRWFLAATWYAGRMNGRRLILMHAAITGGRTDHINGDKLDNRRGNLRRCTQAQNCQNHNRLLSNNTSGYRGVSYDKQTGRWEAYSKLNGRRVHLGRHDTPERADGAVKAWRADHMPFSADARAA